MKHITLTMFELHRINLIRDCLINNLPIASAEKLFLFKLLSAIPTVNSLLLKKTPLNETFELRTLDFQRLKSHLRKWINLFKNIPGIDYAASCHMVGNDDIDMLSKNVIIIATFAPSLAYNLNEAKEGFEIYLKDDGTAVFSVPTLQDAEQYPELYNFKGTWKEAYFLLIETLKKGWPMDEFPEELKQFLKK